MVPQARHCLVTPAKRMAMSMRSKSLTASSATKPRRIGVEARTDCVALIPFETEDSGHHNFIKIESELITIGLVVRCSQHDRARRRVDPVVVLAGRMIDHRRECDAILHDLCRLGPGAPASHRAYRGVHGRQASRCQ